MINRMKNMNNSKREIVFFIAIGFINTIIGYILMFVLYNIFYFTYWKTTLFANLIMIFFSYYFNKNITFRNTDLKIKTFIFFCIHILVCYLTAYKIARSIIFFISIKIFHFDSLSVIDNMAMLLGGLIFILLNFAGQKYWVFNKKG